MSNRNSTCSFPQALVANRALESLADREGVHTKEEDMDRYLIETPHTGQECLDLIKLLNAQGYLWNFDWGCKTGIHSGWIIIDAENEAQARLVVPPLVR